VKATSYRHATHALTIRGKLQVIRNQYSGRKITESLGKRHSKRGKRWKEEEWSAIVNSLSMYSKTENIYYSQLSSVEILLQPEPNCFTSYNTRK
jgi:hypothetical protein